MADASGDFATMDQVDSIQKEIANTTALVSEDQDLAGLKLDYKEDDLIYQGKIDCLLKTYRRLRRTRPDGNCFFRAFSFAFLEYLGTRETEMKAFRELLEQRRKELVAAGFPEFTTQDFFDVVDDASEQIAKASSVEELRRTFCDDSLSDYIVVCMRLVTSGELQKNGEFYMNFVQDFATMKDFCAHEVEPMYRESDHLHISALTSSLGVPVRVVYMDRGGDGEVNHHDFQEEKGTPVVTLLYRPGHYDVLYS